MSQSNTLSPTVAGQDPDVGSTTSWGTLSNIVSSNNSYATCTITSTATQIVDKEVKLRIGFDSEFSISIYASSNLASGAWPTTDTYVTYGSDTQLWGTTLTPTIVNDTPFGLGMSCQTSDPTPLYSSTLYGSEFGFAIPSRANIRGVSGRIERKATWSSRTNVWTMSVDHYELTVHYTVFLPQINMRFFGFLGLLSKVAAMGWLSMFNVDKIDAIDGGIIISKSQSRRAGKLAFI